MNESEVVRELSRRASVPEPAAGAILQAIRELVRDGVVGDEVLRPAREPNDPLQLTSPPEPLPVVAHTDPGLVDDLIARARKHPLGLTFLLTGFLGSVAIALGAHAFTVEAARERLRKELELEKHSKEPIEA